MWLALSGFFNPLFITLGLISCAISIILYVLLDKLNVGSVSFSPSFIFKFPIYLIWLIKEIVISSIVVTAKIWDFSENNISPGMEWISVNCKDDLSLTILANTITITPGTLTVDERKGAIRVHFLNKKDIKDFKKGEFERKISFLCGGNESK